MFRYAALALLASAAAVQGLVASLPVHNATLGRTCGSHLDQAVVNKMEADFNAKKVAFAPSSTSKLAASPIQIYFHVIYSSTAVAGGYVPESQLDAQVTVMNQDYAGSGFTFVKAGTDRTLNAAWFTGVGPDSTSQTTMKNQLRKGGAGELLLTPTL
jgi:hypothetical protein